MGLQIDKVDAASAKDNELAQLVAEITNATEQGVSLSFSSDDLGAFAGAVTTGGFSTNVAAIRINPAQLPGVGVLGSLWQDASRGVPASLVGRVVVGPVSLGQAIFHELGDGVGQVRRGPTAQTDETAVHYENTHRFLTGDAFFRRSHSKKEAFWVPVQ